MSQNLYENVPSLPNSGGGVAAQQKPAGLTAVPVICLILGLLGSLVTLAGLSMLAFQSFNGGPPTIPTAGAPGMAEYQTEMVELQQQQFFPNLIVNAAGLIVGVLLVVGAIGVFGLKEWARNLLRNALLFAAIFVVLRGVYTAWIQYRTIGMLKGVMAPPGGGETAAFEMGMKVGLIAVIVVGLVWGAALAGFYLWSRGYLNRPSVVALFRTPEK